MTLEQERGTINNEIERKKTCIKILERPVIKIERGKEIILPHKNAGRIAYLKNEIKILEEELKLL